MEKHLYVIRITEYLNYGVDAIYRYADDYDSAMNWIEENYGELAEDSDGDLVDRENDIRIEVKLASKIK